MTMAPSTERTAMTSSRFKMVAGSRCLTLFVLLASATSGGCLGADPRQADELTATTSALTPCPHSTSRRDRVDNGFWMETFLSYQPATGAVMARTTLSTSLSFAGFTGGVIAIFVNDA